MTFQLHYRKPVTIFTKKSHLRCFTAQKMKFSIKDFFSKCDQIRSFLQIWSHLLKKYLMKNFNFCAVFERVLTKFLLSVHCSFLLFLDLASHKSLYVSLQLFCNSLLLISRSLRRNSP